MQHDFSVKINFDTPDSNGRVYSRKAFEEALAGYQKMIDERRSLGMFLDSRIGYTTDLRETTHLVTKAELDGDNLNVSIDTLVSPGYGDDIISTKGDALESMIESGSKTLVRPIMLGDDIISFDVLIEN